MSATYDPPGGTAATDLGIMEQGYDVSWRLAGEPIAESDAYGLMFIDMVYRGLSDVFIGCDALEYKAGPLLAVSPFNAMTPTGSSVLAPGVVGRLMSNMAGVLILTATAATPAASSPATLTATYSHLAENFDVSLLKNSKLKKVPIRFRVLPYLDSVIKFFTTT
jgi:hypothetical protein